MMLLLFSSGLNFKNCPKYLLFLYNFVKPFCLDFPAGGVNPDQKFYTPFIIVCYGHNPGDALQCYKGACGVPCGPCAPGMIPGEIISPCSDEMRYMEPLFMKVYGGVWVREDPWNDK